MNYSEFVEALAACAVYKIPDPFVSTPSKVNNFLVKSIIPRARRRR